MEVVSSSETSSVSTRLHSATSQKTDIFILNHHDNLKSHKNTINYYTPRAEFVTFEINVLWISILCTEQKSQSKWNVVHIYDIYVSLFTLLPLKHKPLIILTELTPNIWNYFTITGLLYYWLGFFSGTMMSNDTVPISNSASYSMTTLKYTKQWEPNMYRKCISFNITQPQQ
jgi:hypothetical protein